MLRSLAAILIAVVLATSATARTDDPPPPAVAQQAETATETAIRKALAELEGKRAEVAALKETIGAKDKHIKALNELLDQSAEIIEQWKLAAKERGTANSLDAKLEESYKLSISRYAVELANVRIERDRARAAKKWWGLAGLAFGFAVGVLVVRGE